MNTKIEKQIEKLRKQGLSVSEATKLTLQQEMYNGIIDAIDNFGEKIDLVTAVLAKNNSVPQRKKEE